MLENGNWDALGTNSLSVILTGIVLVFVILIILIVAIKIVSLIVNLFIGTGKKEKNTAEKKTDKPADSAVKASVAAPESNSGAVIAAISAAVAMMLGHGNFKITGLRKKAPIQGHNPWKLAGMQENTRPF